MSLDDGGNSAIGIIIGPCRIYPSYASTKIAPKMS